MSKLSLETVRDLYYEKKLSICMIARSTNTSYTRVLNFMIQNRMPR